MHPALPSTGNHLQSINVFAQNHRGVGLALPG